MLSQLDPHFQVLPLSGSASKKDRRLPFLLKTTGTPLKPAKNDRLKLVMNVSKDLFAVWWSTGEVSAGTLLFRLNTSSCQLTPLASLQPSAPQKLLLVAFSNTASCELFVIEWYQVDKHKINYLTLVITTYLIDQEEFVQLDSSSLYIPDRQNQLQPTMAALAPRDDRLVVATLNGCVFLLNVRSCVVASSTDKFATGIASLAWHPAGSLIAVVDLTGRLFILDLGLTPLDLFELHQHNTNPFYSLGDFDANSKSLLFPPILSWNPDNTGLQVKKSIIHQKTDNEEQRSDGGCLVVAWAGLRGLGLVKLKLPQWPTSSCIIRHWLSLSRTYSAGRTSRQRADPALCAAVAIVSALDFDIDGEQAVRCVTATATALLRHRPMNALVDNLLDRCLGCFCNPAAPISEVTKLEFGPVISRILRRRAIHLLRHGKFEAAFDVAANKLPQPATDLLTDIFYAAMERGELALAKAAYARARRQVAVAAASLELPISTEPDSSNKRDSNPNNREEEHYFV